MEEIIKQLQFKNSHLEWHCATYQHTLEKLKGMKEHEKTLAEFESRQEPVCLHCNNEELLRKIEDLEAKSANS